MKMEPIRYYSLTEQVYDSVKRSILQGKIVAHEKLDINQLAIELGVSRMPIVDALTRLEVEGLVERRNRVGTFVRPISQQLFCELFETRAMIEEWATPHVIQRASDADFAQLQQLLDDAQPQLQHSEQAHFDFAQFNEIYDMGFHLGLVRLAGNSYTSEAYRMLNSRIRIGRVFVPLPFPRAMFAQTDHERILQAFQARNLQTALETQQEHRHASLQTTLDMMSAHAIT